MNWVERNGMHLSAPYRIYSGVKGFEAWHYGVQSFVLGKQIGTLEAAKAICEKHKLKEAKCAPSA